MHVHPSIRVLECYLLMLIRIGSDVDETLPDALLVVRSPLGGLSGACHAQFGTNGNSGTKLTLGPLTRIQSG